MPDFAMPPEPTLDPTDALTRSAPGPLAHAPAAAQPVPVPDVARMVSWATLWRVIAATLVVGAAAGIGINTAARSFEVSAAEADRAALAAAAASYLTAIAEGRATDANTLVPPPGRPGLLSDHVLRDAARITEAEVLAPHVEGDRGWVNVRYRHGYVNVERTLRAVRDAGGWQVSTSLAEAVQPAWWLPGIVSISGASVHESTLLYPGGYMTDAFDDGAITLASTRVWVDGDPTTPTSLVIEPGVHAETAARLGDVAVGFLERCRASGACDIGAGALEARTQAGVDVDGFDGHGWVDVVIVVVRSDPPATVDPVHVGVRGDVLRDGGELRCGLLDEERDVVPTWSACTP